MKSHKPTATTKTTSLIDYLFKRFTFIWDRKWTDKIDGIEAQKREIWSNAIAGMSRKQIDAGIKKASCTFIWPPEIPEFIKICTAENEDLITRITPAKAIEIAEKKIRNKFTPQNYPQIILERDALAVLQNKIMQDQNDTADLIFCNTSDCFKFIIDNRELCWHCSEHANEGKG